MQSTQEGEFPGKSSIKFLPMIDLNPSDMSCIYSTLLFVCEEADKHHTTPILTFDQPLYWKASSILQSENPDSRLKKVVLRLGGFHLQMSFLGAIGHIMQSTGIQEVLETVYASNAVEYMLSGKAVSRAVRGHFLVESALSMMIVSDLYDIALPITRTQIGDTTEGADDVQESQNIESESLQCIHMPDEHSDVNEIDQKSEKDTIDSIPTDLNYISTLYEKIVKKEIAAEDVLNDPVLEKARTRLETKMQDLKQYPTASMWIQYIEMVEILKKFIKAERTGNWQLHLSVMQEMLPYLAAAGHNQYAKSAYLYLQQMHQLKETNPVVHEQLANGYHVVRRSNRYWAGISTDLTIEQTLMRTLKSTGGMTRGKGMNEVQRAQWLLSMPICAAVNSSMQVFAEVCYHSSEQHKECSPSRQERDWNDLVTILTFLEERNPFAIGPSLRDIETGVTSSEKVNANKAAEVGTRSIVKRMAEQNVFEVSFKKGDRIITMNTQSTLLVGSDIVPVCSQLLFQRLLVAATHLSDDMASVFSHELCPFPSSLFDNTGCMREAQKATLADTLWALGECSSSSEDNSHDMTYVLDGGSLLHKIPWQRGYTFKGICDLYVDYVLKGYNSPTVVLMTIWKGLQQRTVLINDEPKALWAQKVIFSGAMPFRSKKEHFLANSENKQTFINLLALTLENAGCKVVHARSDADVCIVKTAVASAFTSPITLIGEDTDLLVLLCYHADLNNNDIVFRSDRMIPNRKPKVLMSIHNTKLVLGAQMCNVLRIHPSMHLQDVTQLHDYLELGKGAL